MWNMSNLLGAFQKSGVCGLVVNSITLEKMWKTKNRLPKPISEIKGQNR